MMDIEFYCEKCGKLLVASVGHVGKEADCPACGKAIIISSPREESSVEKVEKTRGEESRKGKPHLQKPGSQRKRRLSRNGVLALAIFLAIALSTLIYYSQFVRTVEVVSGHQTICKKCEKILEDSRSVVRVRAIDRRKHRATTTWVLCKDCKQVEAIRAARVQDSLQRGFWIVLILIFIYLFARYPRFRNVVLICIGIKIVLWFLLSLSGTTRTCRHCRGSVSATAAICKHCNRLLS